MDATLLARLQFAITVGFHFIFPPLTIGLSWFIVWFLAKHKKTADEIDKKTAHFWTRIFTVTFVIGVVTGVPLEFQFGTNWAQFSQFVGDVFGAPLAAEVIFTFFVESIFIAVLVYGWNKVSTKTLLISSIMVAVSSTLSAFWILAANSWMQTPAGYELTQGKVLMTNFWDVIFNPSTLPRFLHTLDASLMTGAFFMLGISALLLIMSRHKQIAEKSLKFSVIVAFISSIIQLGLGHYHSIQVAHTQPEKLAAIEGVFETQQMAPAIVFGIPNEDKEQIEAEVKIPGLLSLLAFGDLDAEVKGLKEFPRDEWPPLALTFYPFHLMVGMGLYLIFLGALGLLLLWRKRLIENKLFMKLAVISIPIPFIANELGWITAEVGRQPWAVYHILKTRDAISISVPAGHILFSIITFGLIYILLFALWIYLIRREIISEIKN